jgi:hypothetical protein
LFDCHIEWMEPRMELAKLVSSIIKPTPSSSGRGKNRLDIGVGVEVEIAIEWKHEMFPA